MSPNTLLLTFPQDLRIQGPPQTHLTQLSLLPLAPKPQTPPTHWALAPAQSLHPLSHTMIPTVLKMCPVPPQPQPLFSTQHLHSVTCFCLQTVLQPSSSSTSAPPRPVYLWACASHLLGPTATLGPPTSPLSRNTLPVWVPEAQRCQHLRVAAPLIPPFPVSKAGVARVGPSPPPHRFSTCPLPSRGLNCHALQLQISAPASAFSQVTAACLLDTSDQ